MLIIAIDVITSTIPTTLQGPSSSPKMNVPNSVAATFSTADNIGAYYTCLSLVIAKPYMKYGRATDVEPLIILISASFPSA